MCVFVDWALLLVDVFVVYLECVNLLVKVSVFIDFFIDWFEKEVVWMVIF